MTRYMIRPEMYDSTTLGSTAFIECPLFSYSLTGEFQITGEHESLHKRDADVLRCSIPAGEAGDGMAMTPAHIQLAARRGWKL